MKSLRTRIEPAAAALVVATLLSGRQIASWTTVFNRYHFRWQTLDGLALVAAVLLLAAILYGLGMALARIEWTRRRRLHELALVAGVGAALLTQVNKFAQNIDPLRALALWVVAGGVLALAWRRWPSRLASVVRGACLVMSPLVPMLLVQILLWRPWDIREHSSADGPPPGASPGHARLPVVIVVFDEWSWFRVAPDGNPSPEFANLRRLADRAMLVSEARSPSDQTAISMPRFLYQERGEIIIGNGVAWWDVAGVRRPAPDVPDIFDRARELGYRTQLLSFGLPYRALLGPDAPDRILTLSLSSKGRTWAEEVLKRGMNNLGSWTDPVSKLVWEPYSISLYAENWRHVTQSLRLVTLKALGEEPDNTLIVSHFPVPHYPFIWNPDGSYRGPLAGSRSTGDPEGYERNLRYADRILGEILDTLERSGRLDRSLLIVTSDHSWRKEPNARLLARPDALRRVPLLIKWPGQTRPMVSDQQFCTMGIGPVLEAVLTASPAGPPELTDSLWMVLSEKGRRETCEE